MAKKHKIYESMQELNPHAPAIEGYDDCIIGIGGNANTNDVFIYDSDKMIEKLMKTSGMNFEKACLIFNTEVMVTSFGHDTPIFVRTLKKGFRKPKTLMEVLGIDTSAMDGDIINSIL